MIDSGSIRKYLLYAIGEIALVVIGILIALQINNWNENRKVDYTRDIYLRQILSDLETDKIYYNEVITVLESNLKGYNNYKNISAEPGMDIYKIIAETENVNFFHLEITIKTNTIKTLISTGDIKLFPSTFRNTLTSYLGSQNRSVIRASNNNSNSKDILQNATMNGANKGIMRLLNQPSIRKYLYTESHTVKLLLELEAWMNWKELGESFTIETFKSLIKDADDIIATIREELNN